MSWIAQTPEPPYTAVIFTSTRTPGDNGYPEAAVAMVTLAAQQQGYLGIETVAQGDQGITVSYWATPDDARRWKRVAEHRVAQRRGREEWYADFRVRVATVERDYGPTG